MKKLTLTAEPEVIDMAKKLAEARGTSVSAMFSQLIRAMADKRLGRSDRTGPITRRLTGIAKPSRGKSDRQIIEDALLRRYAS
ncbi:MAG TPA: DUF6364 family protein [Tepidisphaeraceae bacterium]|jgi:hypothetical protein|nr:DUF6364 family protein [Tepidisphaeraceae bacterium]